MLEINPGLTIWTVVTFLILLGLLRMFAWKPILKALASREDAIREALDNAEKTRQETERLLAENSTRMAAVEAEAGRLLQEARLEAERRKEEIATLAREEASRIMKSAHAEIERSQRAAMKSLQHEVAALAIQAAERILKETLDEARQRKLTDTIIAGLSKN
jgi:F-type H+-transporting ATPase subunit b